MVRAKPAPHLLTALGSSESPIMPKHFGEIFKPEEQPKLEQTIGTCPILKEWVPGNSVP
jgi:peptide/nickel transport system substrate-binding protein